MQPSANPAQPTATGRSSPVSGNGGTPPAAPITVGNVSVVVPYVPAPARPGFWIQYVDMHDQAMVPLAVEAARLIHQAAPLKNHLYTVESSTYEIGFALRTTYGRQVVSISKRLLPSFTSRNTERVVYHPYTADAPRQLFFPKRADASERLTVTLFDTITTTGQTLRAAAEALRRQNIFVDKAIVLFTEAEEGHPHLSEIVVSDDYRFPIEAFAQLTRRRVEHPKASPKQSPQSRPLLQQSPLQAAALPLPTAQGKAELDHTKDSISSLEDADDDATAPLVKYTLYSEAVIPTLYGEVEFAVFTGTTGRNAICVVGRGGRLDVSQPVLVRLHDACITSECFKSCKCDCREQLEAALTVVQQEGGMVIYLLQEGRGIGLAAKIAAYALQQTKSLDTVDANRALGLPDDARTYEAARDILRHFHVTQVALMSNNPAKREKLEALGVDVVAMRPVVVAPNSEHCRRYLETKSARMQHLIPADAVAKPLVEADETRGAVVAR